PARRASCARSPAAASCCKKDANCSRSEHTCVGSCSRSSASVIRMESRPVGVRTRTGPLRSLMVIVTWEHFLVAAGEHGDARQDSLKLVQRRPDANAIFAKSHFADRSFVAALPLLDNRQR